MNIARRMLEAGYFLLKPLIFSLTKNDPEEAHELFIRSANFLYSAGLDKIILDHTDNSHRRIEISNAAGFNKNGDIPPSFMGYLGFDRIVIGTVTADYWKGNERPRIIRYPSSNSLVNWMGLPGVGAEKVVENVLSYNNGGIPLTINLMSTPGKKGDTMLKDIETTTSLLKDVPYVDRFELNVSCPNTSSSSEGKLDARKEYQRAMGDMLDVVRSTMHDSQDLYVKLSPDLDNEGIEDTVHILTSKGAKGITISNTTTSPKVHLVPSYEKGGASGNAVYDSSLRVQKQFNNCGTGLEIIACGGIDSLEKLNERLKFGARGIQIYTPIIFKGPKLLRELRSRK